MWVVRTMHLRRIIGDGTLVSRFIIRIRDIFLVYMVDIEDKGSICTPLIP